MDDITLEHLQDFIKHSSFELKPTQDKLCFPVLERIIKKIRRGAKFNPIHVVDNLIINGHHRYFCFCFLNLAIETTTWRRGGATVAKNWSDIVIEAEDWDKPEDIERYEKTAFPKI